MVSPCGTSRLTGKEHCTDRNQEVASAPPAKWVLGKFLNQSLGFIMLKMGEIILAVVIVIMTIIKLIIKVKNSRLYETLAGAGNCARTASALSERPAWHLGRSALQKNPLCR